MFIALAADGKELESQISAKFELCKYLLIVNMADLAVEAIENTGDPRGEDLSRKIIHHNCEVIITGELTPEAFELLVGACVTRYDGYGYTAKNALTLMNQYSLKLIRNTDGTDDCDGDHHHHELA